MSEEPILSDPSLPPAVPPPAEPDLDVLVAWRQFRAGVTARGLMLDVFLVLLVVVGVVFRFSWLNWNEDTNLHPDEYGLTSTLTQLRMPKTLGDYFNTRLSPLSPYQKYDKAGDPLDPSSEHPMPDNRMRWGQWPLILIRWSAEMSGNTGYTELRLWGRFLSGLADTLALLVTFFIGWRLYGHYRVGLLAAALSALAVMQIQQSHFMTVDNFAVLFVTLAMACAVQVVATTRRPAETGAARPAGGWGGAWQWYIGFGVFFGMALASRVNLLPLFGLIGVAAVIAAAPAWMAGQHSHWVSDVIQRLALAGIVAVVAFRVTQPMAFRAPQGDTTLLTLNPNKEWMESMAVASAESSGQAGGPPGEQWTNRPALVFPWVNMVVWGMGVPLGLMAWAAFAWAVWRSLRPGDDWQTQLLPLIWVGGYFLFMGTRWVKSVRYFLPIYPFLILLAAWAIMELWRLAERRQAAAPGGRSGRVFQASAALLFGVVTVGTLAWAWGFTSIYRHENTRLQAVRWIYQNIPAPLNLQWQLADGEKYNDPLPAFAGTQLSADDPLVLPFRARFTGTLAGFAVGHARNSYGDAVAGRIHVRVSRDAAGQDVLGEADLAVDAVSTDKRGGPASAPLANVALTEGETYYLTLTAPEGGPIEIAGSMVSNENWDEGLPVPFDSRDPFGGLYTGLTMEVHWGDDANKRQMFLDTLTQTDYVFVQSQRRLWSASRLPNNYPMTLEYYRALFDGRLGFDLVAQFQSPFVIGPLQVSDLTGTWAWGQAPAVPARGKDYPFNPSLLAAEEAFSVYDHAPVWIFRKRADFDINQVRAILGAVDLSQVYVQGPREATAAPTLLMLPADRWAEQQAGGTWRVMFDPLAFINSNEPVGVVVWWLTLLLLGWAAFPLTAAALGGLADRGYALSRTVALVVVTWLAWILGSYRLLPFTQWTVALCVLALVLASGALAWRRRTMLRAYIREHRRYILTVELVTLALFLLDLLIRWGNPDLWHPSYGGERPMVFSFLNAVLKSTSFPPYNPWMSGAFLNYYYYGFVLVSIPIKLLGVVPTFAFNLTLPTLFALTGINAFGVAYNLVQHSAARLKPAEPAPAGPTAAVPEVSPDNPVGTAPAPAMPVIPVPPVVYRPSPYLAGLAAALLVVVLGNLGQVHTLLTGFERAGDRNAYAGTPIGSGDLSAMLDGGLKVLSGKVNIPLGTGEWYWNASRIVTNINGKGSEITEFPFFTFLYSDLHAHMIDLPLALLALAWAISYLLAGRSKRPLVDSLALWGLGGLALGVTNPTNSWDFPTYLALGVVAVATAHLLRSEQPARERWLGAAWRAILLVGLAVALYRPFEQWFAPAYSEFKRNLDTNAPLSAYLYIHGLFLFILTTFLLWETRRWLAETPASVVTRADDWLPWVALVFLALLVSVAALWFLHVPIGVLALPLMAWAGLLLLRSPAAMPPEKQAVLFLTGTALAITVFVELFSIGGDRMNTIFKFYMQVWVLFSVAAGAALAWIWAELPRWRPGRRTLWQGGLSLLVAAAALYTVTATNAKIRDRFPQNAAQPTGTLNAGCQQIPGVPMPANYVNDHSLAVSDQPHTLDSMQYMTWSAYCDSTYFVPLAYDADAIQWMQTHVTGSPVIVEANVTEYRWGNRFTIYTGLPGVVGWSYHTRQHRGIVSSEMVTRRVDEVRAFYCSPTLTGGVYNDYTQLPEMCRLPIEYGTIDYNWVINFLKRYQVGYVIVGAYERAVYAPEGLLKFDMLEANGVLTPVYTNPGTVIYQVTLHD